MTRPVQVSTHARVRKIQMWTMRWIRFLFPPRLEPGTATVVIAYWRTPDHLRIGLERIRRHSDRSVLRRVIVVDNASGDDAAGRQADGFVEVHRMPVNVGHAIALDWAAWQVRTEFMIALDSDAWPISDRWLEAVLGPLREGAAVSGIRQFSNYIHPSGLATKTSLLRRYRLSFQERYPSFPMEHDAPYRGPEFWDVGERITWLLRRHGFEIHPIDPDRSRDEYVGATYGGVLYHQWYGSRLEAEPDRQEFDGIPRAVIEAETLRWSGGLSS